MDRFKNPKRHYFMLK